MSFRALWQTLHDPTRLRILALLEEEELSVAELQEILHLGQSRISTHLAHLRRVGLVHPRREGKRTYYSLVKKLDKETRQILDSALLTLTEVPGAKADTAGLQARAGKAPRHRARIFQPRRRAARQKLLPGPHLDRDRAAAGAPRSARRRRRPRRGRRLALATARAPRGESHRGRQLAEDGRVRPRRGEEKGHRESRVSPRRPGRAADPAAQRRYRHPEPGAAPRGQSAAGAWPPRRSCCARAGGSSCST